MGKNLKELSAMVVIVIAMAMMMCSTGCESSGEENNDGFNNSVNNATTCGNGFIEAGEEFCDGVQLDGATCTNLGFEGGGTVTCGENCMFDVSQCYRTNCGNGVLDPEEECDGELFTTDASSCTDFGWYYGDTVCTSECTVSDETCAGECGDGVWDPEFEDCDGLQFDENDTSYTNVVYDVERGTCDTVFPDRQLNNGATPRCFGCYELDFTSCLH